MNEFVLTRSDFIFWLVVAFVGGGLVIYFTAKKAEQDSQCQCMTCKTHREHPISD